MSVRKQKKNGNSERNIYMTAQRKYENKINSISPILKIGIKGISTKNGHNSQGY